MTHQYLLEIGLEEVPARFLKSLSQQLQDRVEAFLEEARLDFSHSQAFASPRRLAVLVHALADRQADQVDKVKGPSLKIARDDQGAWTQAAQGFVRGQGMTVEDIYVESLKGVDYIFVDRKELGQPASQVLQDMVSVLEAMTFQVSMTWHDYHKPYIRPVHWIVSLLDNLVVPFSFYNITSGRTSHGHRFLGGPVDLDQAGDYPKALEASYVLADFEARQGVISQQIQALAQDQGWQVPQDPDLLEEVTALVEWPTAFSGDFDPSYLDLPDLILTTAMKDHQRYFYALKDGQVQPVFISVRNGDDHQLDNVIKGNEKVLRARLEDALFFYQDDLSRSIDYFVDKLAHIREHKDIGSLADKMSRVEDIIRVVGDFIPISQEDLETGLEASRLYKFDLATGMVGEFSELQGEMAGIYARDFGLGESLAQALTSQYYPVAAGAPLPSQPAGALLAWADKLDSLVQYFNAGLIPTGSADPFALRRQATGLVEITIDQAWGIDLDRLLDRLVDHFQLEAEGLKELVLDFIQARTSVHLDREVDYDIIQGVLASRHQRIPDKVQAAQVLQDLKDTETDAYRGLIETLRRVSNLGDDQFGGSLTIQEDLLETNSERALVRRIQDLDLEGQASSDQVQTLLNLVPAIEAYFEDTMVHAEDPAVKANRLATMGRLTESIYQVLDPRQVLSKF